MKLQTAKYPEFSTYRQNLEQAKLKLKNESPDALVQAVQAARVNSAKSFRARFQLTPPTPIFVEALAELHHEAQYTHTVRPAGQSMWDAALAYAAHKPLALCPNAGRPLPRRTTSDSSSVASSRKSVQWAELEAEVLLFDKRLPPKEVGR